MAHITPPKYVKQILLTLQSREHRAYLVGGCVRDMLLGTAPNDWDICTSALPEEIMEIFPGSRPTGIKHGTVTVVVGSHSAEVTTFRTDGDYSDHRRPDSISFVSDLSVDLSRRDFTMNAIAVSPDGLTVDPFNGMGDIARKTVKCVGEPDRRFYEDALRMFRALRFAARLDFSIEENTFAAIERQAPLCAQLAPERVRDELEKTLLTNHAEMLGVMIEKGLLKRYITGAGWAQPDFSIVSTLQKKALPRWSVFSVMLEKNGFIPSAGEFLECLRLDGRTVRCCSDASHILKSPMPEDKLGWKKLLNKYGVDSATCAAVTSDAIFATDCERQLYSVLKSGECFSLKRLAISGDDLLDLGYRGPELGEMMNFLLDYVMEHPDNNKPELLLALARVSEEN